MRYRLTLSYLGTRYHGWQKQPNAISVQETLEEAVHRLTREAVSIVGAGRTDQGVHAEFYVAHFDLEKPREPIWLMDKLNAVLPYDIAIHDVATASADFHARFDAKKRTYEYRLCRVKDPFFHGRTLFYPYPLDVERMQRAAEQMVGARSFACFCKSGGASESMRCELMHSEWSEKFPLLIYRVSADRFLRNMVRAMVGTLLQVGRGKRETDLNALFASEDRAQAGESVPPEGLFLTNIEY